MNILILRIGRMGDMVMILPALLAIRQRYPEANLYAITSQDGLRLLPLIGINPQHICVFRSRVHYRLIDTLKVKRWLAQQTFAHVFSFESKKRSVKWLPKHARILKSSTYPQHYSLRCLQLVSPQPVQMSFTQNQPYLPLLPHHRMACEERLHSYGITSKTIVVGLHPSYSGFGKWGRQTEKKHRLWPVEYFAQLALELSTYAKQHDIDLKIVVNVLPKEQALSHALIQKSKGAIITVTMDAGFPSYLAYIQRLNVLVVGNTGVLHLAAALNTPLVALFSGYSPDDCGPYMAAHRHIVLCAQDTPNASFGIAAITVESVFQATLKLQQGTQ